MAVPKVSVESYYGKLKQVMNITEKKKRKQKVSGDQEVEEKQEAVETEDDDDDDFLIVDDTISTSSASRKYLFWKFTGQYSFALVFIVGLFSLMTVITYFNCLTLIQWGIRSDLSLRIRFVLWRLAYDVHMLAENDVATYADINSLKDNLVKDLALYNDIQLALLFGNPKLGLDVGRLPDVLRPVMFVRNYMGNT